MRAGSKGEEEFLLHCRVHGIDVLREFRFHPQRRWRFDFALPEHHIGIEIEGGTWAAGRHNRGSGYEADCRKYSAAAVLGWRIIRATTQMVASGEAIDLVLAALGRK